MIHNSTTLAVRDELTLGSKRISNEEHRGHEITGSKSLKCIQHRVENQKSQNRSVNIRIRSVASSHIGSIRAHHILSRKYGRHP
jgi:hypothetical protein